MACKLSIHKFEDIVKNIKCSKYANIKIKYYKKIKYSLNINFSRNLNGFTLKLISGTIASKRLTINFPVREEIH